MHHVPVMQYLRIRNRIYSECPGSKNERGNNGLCIYFLIYFKGTTHIFLEK